MPYNRFKYHSVAQLEYSLSNRFFGAVMPRYTVITFLWFLDSDTQLKRAFGLLYKNTLIYEKVSLFSGKKRTREHFELIRDI
jgi:hypothetical protein